MSRCEFHEIALSALLDGALAPAEVPPTLDHLLGCPSCQSFYRDARDLGRLLRPVGQGKETEAVESAAKPAAGLTRPGGRSADDLWRRIEAGARRGRRLPAWAVRAAAVLLLVAGGFWAVARGPALPGAGRTPREIVLGSAAGRMSEERFVDLATEVLEADPRYQREMLRVLREVNEESGRPEAPVEDGEVSEREGAGEERPGGPV